MKFITIAVHFLCVLFYGSIFNPSISFYLHNNLIIQMMKDGLHSPESEMKALKLTVINTVIKSFQLLIQGISILTSCIRLLTHNLT